MYGEAGTHRCQVMCVVMYAWRGWGSSLSGNVYSNVCMERLGSSLSGTVCSNVCVERLRLIAVCSNVCM